MKCAYTNGDLVFAFLVLVEEVDNVCLCHQPLGPVAAAHVKGEGGATTFGIRDKVVYDVTLDSV